MDTIRRRNPFKADGGDGSDADDTILDEQEQEEVIKQFKLENEKTTRTNTVILLVALELSTAIQIIYLYRLMTHSSSSATPPKTPLSPFFDSPPQSPIPLAFIFCIIAISAHLLHVPLLVSSARLPTFPKSFQPHIEVRMIPELIVAPLISLVMKKDLAQTLFWTIPVVVAGVLLQAERWIIEGREAVDRLERLKYTSKGV